MTSEQLNEKLRANSSLRKRNQHLNQVPDRVVSATEPERSAAPEPMAKIEREAVSQERRLVRIASFRVKFADDDNVYIKDVLDALKESGAIFDDSPVWCKTETSQCRVESPALERTEITIERLA